MRPAEADTTSGPLLPARFDGLAPFAHWALEPERARTAQRVAASMEEIRAFYDAMMQRIDEILDYLERHYGDNMPAPVHRLFLMSLSLVEVVALVELYGRREVIDACDPLRFIPQR